ncbi:hypothetical protein AAG906_024434 [Vitis piasezkii]
MVFSSVPVYLDPPNWQQQANHQPGGSNDNPHLPPQQAPPPLPPVGGGGSGGTGTIRPGSMADRARLAKLPQPETALKCPRCESTNTKFCYFNNYSLSQPRHFCKACRRYWTRGGALRNVPVGGGCRRNKRSKGNRSKSPVTGERQGGSSSASAVPSNSCTSDMIGHLPRHHHHPNYPFWPLCITLLTTGPGTLLPRGSGHLRAKALDSGVTQMTAVKIEENQGLNLSRNFLGLPGNDQYWSGNTWNDLSGSVKAKSAQR